MSRPKVFVSSTCYDLTVVRFELREFIKSLGYEPVMSDQTDVLYSPDTHTHESCVNQISTCDLVILIIGSRYGGKAKDAAFKSLNIDKLKKIIKNWDESQLNDYSITQLEAIKAIEQKIPIFTFVDSKVNHEHHIYRANKKEGNNNIIYPSITNQDTAEYIFDFIHFITSLDYNNSLFEFSNVSDIKSQLKSQWAFLFQELLSKKSRYNKSYDINEKLSRKFSDLKEAILSTIENKDKQKTARIITEYRSLISFVLSFDVPDEMTTIALKNSTWDELLESLGVTKIKEEDIGNGGRPKVILLRKNDYYKCNYSISYLHNMETKWLKFIHLDENLKQEVIDSLSKDDINSFSPLKRIKSKYRQQENE